VVLDPTDGFPFLGDIAPGKTVRSFENNMYKAPVAKHKPKYTGTHSNVIDHKMEFFRVFD
jgi:hypothetical protein